MSDRGDTAGDGRVRRRQRSLANALGAMGLVAAVCIPVAAFADWPSNQHLLLLKAPTYLTLAFSLCAVVLGVIPYLADRRAQSSVSDGVTSGVWLGMLAAAMSLLLAWGLAQPHPERTCFEKMKELMGGIDGYCRDHHGYFPDPKRWQKQIRPYFKVYHTRQFIWSQEGREDHGFAMNIRLAGCRMQDVRTPACTVVLFECPFGSPMWGDERSLRSGPFHESLGPKYEIGWADGSVRSCSPERMRLVTWDPSRPVMEE